MHEENLRKKELLKRRKKDIFKIVAFATFALIFFIVVVIHNETGENKKYKRYHVRIRKDKNLIALLERGKIVDANVVNASWRLGKSYIGWRVDYDFKAIDPIIHKLKAYWGRSHGPKYYYAELSVGDVVSVIYDACDPKINCEIKRFLNHPGYRNAFKKAGKRHLLDKFEDEYELEYFTHERWGHLQGQR